MNLSFIYWNMRCTVHGFHSFYRCISTCLKCTWTLLPLPLWACQPVKELFRSPTWMLLWDLWRNMLQKSTLARYVFKWINVMLVFQVWLVLNHYSIIMEVFQRHFQQSYCSQPFAKFSYTSKTNFCDHSWAVIVPCHWFIEMNGNQLIVTI